MVPLLVFVLPITLLAELNSLLVGEAAVLHGPGGGTGDDGDMLRLERDEDRESIGWKLDRLEASFVQNAATSGVKAKTSGVNVGGLACVSNDEVGEASREVGEKLRSPACGMAGCWSASGVKVSASGLNPRFTAWISVSSCPSPAPGFSSQGSE